MKRIIPVLLLLALSVTSAFGQAAFPGQVNPNSNAQNAVVGPAGTVTTPSGTLVNVSPGPLFCNGAINYINSIQFNLLANNTYFIVWNCVQDAVTARFTAPNFGEIPIATVVVGATTVSTITDNRSVLNFPTVTDSYFFVPETACSGATTGTAGAGNATDILAGSGGVRVYRVSATAASSSANTFTCVFQLPGKLSTGKGIQINDITFLVSTQTTQPTSITLPTMKSFTAPAAVDPETANSATFVAFGGTVTQAPTTGQFAAYTAVAAGQFYSVKATLGTPVFSNTDLQSYQFVIVFNQSASAISIQETPGFYVHYSSIPL